MDYIEGDIQSWFGFLFFFLNLLLSFLPGLFIFLCIITGALN